MAIINFFGKKKPKKTEDYKSKDLTNISSDAITIKIFKDFGSNISFKKAEYSAVEKRDKYNNLVSINEDVGHNEDIDFNIDDVYANMNIVLGFKNKDYKEKVGALSKAITRQEKLITALDKYVSLNSIFNYADENLKLRDLTILLNYIKKHDGNGAYFTVEDGTRVYCFESVDGFLVPIWRGVDSYSQYPDHTRKKKITIQEDVIFTKEMERYKRESKLTTSLVITIGLNIIVFVILLFALFKTYGLYQEQDAVLHGQAQQCAAYTSDLNKQYAQMMSIACVKDYIEETDKRKAAEIKAAEENKENTATIGGVVPLSP